MTMLPKVVHALSLSPPLFFFSHICPCLSSTLYFLSPTPHSFPPQGVMHTQTLSHQGAMLHISIYDPKNLVDHLCMCVCTPQPSAYIR